MEFPPGIWYLFRHSPRLLSPPALVYILIRCLRVYYMVQIPNLALVFSMICSTPFLFMLTLYMNDFINYRRAASIGAVLPPRTQDRSPGGINSLLREIKSSKTGYIGDDADAIIEYVGGYTFNLRLLFENRMITAEPDHIKAILATQFDDFEKGPEFRQVMEPLMGTGVFSSDGEMWKFHRSITRPFLSKDRISDFEIFDRHAEDAISQIRLRLRSGHPIDFQDVVGRFTLDSATEFLFGIDVHSLSGGLPYPFYSPLSKITSDYHTDSSTRFAQAFSEAQLISVSRSRFGYKWPLIEFWHDKMKEPMKVVHSLIDPIVAEAIEKKKRLMNAKEGASVAEVETLLENLVTATEDPIILRDAIMSMLVAGRDTTASTLTYTIYMLAEHPHVFQKLREEILYKIGLLRMPTYDDFREMKYLRAVINETLRLYPAVPFDLRTSNKATTWPSTTPGGKPFYIPANTRTPYAIFFMHRRTDLWGPDALEFDPDRFLDERLHKYLVPNPFIFLPFNAGPRICLGQQFAYNEASFFLVRLLQNFSGITLAEDAQPPKSRVPKSWASEGGRKGKERIMPRAHLTLYVEGGLWVRMEESN